MTSLDEVMGLMSLGEDRLFEMMGGTELPEFKRRVEEAVPYVEQFCREYGIFLKDITVTSENGYYEPMFLFDDNLGGYTVEGVMGSLG